jgi:hypothetical protein
MRRCSIFQTIVDPLQLQIEPLNPLGRFALLQHAFLDQPTDHLGADEDRVFGPKLPAAAPDEGDSVIVRLSTFEAFNQSCDRSPVCVTGLYQGVEVHPATTGTNVFTVA